MMFLFLHEALISVKFYASKHIIFKRIHIFDLTVYKMKLNINEEIVSDYVYEVNKVMIFFGFDGFNQSNENCIKNQHKKAAHHIEQSREYDECNIIHSRLMISVKMFHM